VAVRSLQTYQLQAGSNKTRNDLYGKLERARENQRTNRQSPTDAEETRKINFAELFSLSALPFLRLLMSFLRLVRNVPCTMKLTHNVITSPLRAGSELKPDRRAAVVNNVLAGRA
jgi:hypothetical protein